MANETTEPRALTAALAAPAFATRAGGRALHAANRHVERWAPEATAGNVRPMRSLGFVDRLVAPWIETAQRSASLRMFSQYTTSGYAAREGAAVSWVFPRPWYQDELDWMAAARQVSAESAEQPSAPRPTMFTTRGTFVAPSVPVPQQQQQVRAALPTALYEYVAPSLSVAQHAPQRAITGVGQGGGADAYSPLVPLAAVQAAQLMQRAVAPLVASASPAESVGRASPALRTVLTAMLQRATIAQTESRISMQAPELVTPPAPRAADVALPRTAQVQAEPTAETAAAEQLAEQYAEQRARIAEVQRIARVSAERELAIRAEVARAELARTPIASAPAPSAPAPSSTAAPAAQQRAEELRRAQVQAQSEAAAERARVEERVAQRLAERAGQQRLHEQARAEAAEHARAVAAQAAIAQAAAPTTSAAAPAASAGSAAPVAPPEVTAAIAALPPELKAILVQRPERGVAAIAELGEALRTAELIARSTAANQAFEATRGPRLMMPAGLGGLVSAVERAQVIADRPAAIAPLAGPPSPEAAFAPVAPRARAVARVPALPFLQPVAPAAPIVGSYGTFAPSAGAPTTALGATAAASPAALTHVAWADRWLARFAGAAPRSLDIIQASSGGTAEQRMQALAAAAPESVFLRPMFDSAAVPSRIAAPVEAQPEAARAAAPAPVAAPEALVPTPVFRPSPLNVERFDDSAVTPDDVFADIAAAASGARLSQRAPVARADAPAPVPAGPPAPVLPEAARMSAADLVAHAAPSAPGAGLSAQLAASPFAPALRHVLALPAASSFDVRALFGAGLSSTFLAGLIDTGAAGGAHELQISGGALPAWAEAFVPAAAIAAERAAQTERAVPELDLAYVTPDAAAVATPATAEAAASAAQAAEIARYAAPLTTLRTALLSWQVDPAAPAATLAPAQAQIVSAAQTTPAATPAMRAMSDAMRMPMLADAMPGEAAPSLGAPGMIAERAHGWSVAQERSASDLAFDFVPPELVLAARVYGLGAAEAAQAMRLAIAGPGQLAAMASTVDRTFVQAMSIAADRRAELGPPSAQAAFAAPRPVTTAYPMTATPATSATPAAPGVEPAIAAIVGPPRAEALPTAAFGVERRAPRGAFLWPSATIAALGMSAAAPDGDQSLPVAALELLAAQAVAEIGTFAALAAERPAGSPEILGETAIAAAGEAPRAPSAIAGALTAMPSAASAAPVAGGALAEPSESDVLGAATALVPMARRARFDALYVALSQSPSGKSWSPAARAARALALAGRSDTPVSAYERAATAWDVLPVVYATDGMSIAEIDAATATGTLPGVARTLRGPQGGRAAAAMPQIDARPGLAGLTARAGEALGAYVAPSTGEMAQAIVRSEGSGGSREREMPVARRAPSAAQELVQTGRPAGRYGSGDVEIPAWFESAARKMFEDKSGSSMSDGISMSELTLVMAQSAPATQIAASTKAPPAAAPRGAAVASSGESKPAPIDIDAIANDVYREILIMMDAARSRNGEPYL